MKGFDIVADWKLLWSTFVLLFVAELGDKTQLAVILSSANTNRPWTVFLGAALALITVTLIGTLAGQVITRFVSPDILRKGAAGLFVLMGVLMFFEKI
ncbi:MAG: TMEM165/GDT1 family protein [Anaerolineales bacterium]|nr:TMEM165/GDT1 family protein [Anaerolineales bacterium]